MKRISFLLPLLAATTLLSTVPAARADDGDTDPDPVKLSILSRSIFFRPGDSNAPKRGSAGFNGGDYSDKVFDGNFSNYAYQNTAGAEIVIPTTDPDTGAAFFVTEFKVGHQGNAKYSLYYTTEEEPPDILSHTTDPRTWTPIPGATSIQETGVKTYGVNVIATAVKYVFDTVSNWAVSLGEVEVWGVDASQVGCLHPTYTEWRPIPGTATCTANGIDQRECTVCGKIFQRESQTVVKFGHDYQSTLLLAGSGLQYGSGTISCSRHDFEIDCTDGPVDLVPFGGVKMPGVVQFTDLSVSSTGNEDWGVGPEDLIDNVWTKSWGSYWYANTKSVSEYVQFEFGTAIDLTSVEISVPNETQTLRFYSVADGAEELVGEFTVEKDSTIPDQVWSSKENKMEVNPASFQRFEAEFRGVTLRTLRIRSDDANNALTVCEVHPHGTVNGAGRTAAVRTRILID